MKKETIKPVTINKVVKSQLYCDRCEELIESADYFDGFRSEFKLIEGDIYPEGDFTTTYSLDFCQVCAEHVKNLLIADGCKIVETENE